MYCTIGIRRLLSGWVPVAHVAAAPIDELSSVVKADFGFPTLSRVAQLADDLYSYARRIAPPQQRGATQASVVQRKIQG